MGRGARHWGREVAHYPATLPNRPASEGVPLKTKTYRQHGVTVKEHRLNVPLDHSHPSGDQIEIFARELIAPGQENAPYLLFLQGGPGGAGPRPGDFKDGWIGQALKSHRVVLLDQRGTGQSAPFTTLTAPSETQELASYLRLFLQGQIVEDAEALRQELGIQQWETLGQSYGGFLTLAYLSAHPESVSGCYFTGGLPGLVPVDDIYRLTYPQAAKHNQTYFAQYPGDEQTIREVAAHLADTEELLPTGERLTSNRMRMLGMSLGGQLSYDQLHYVFEGPFVTVQGERRLHPQFLAEVGQRVSHQDRPLYAALQEAIYAPTSPGGTRWAAERVSAEFPGFRLDADPLDKREPWYLTGEHMFRSLFQEDPSLRPLLGAVGLLADSEDWEPIYDRSVLSSTEAPMAAAIYVDDMFVPRQLSEETAALLPNMKTLVTNQCQHDGLRAADVFTQLQDLRED